MFKAIRTVYFENDKKKVTEKKYETYKRAKAYAKRYSKLVNGARFVEVEIFLDTDSFKFKNVDIFVADSNGFENERLEEIEKFHKETEEPKKAMKMDTEYLVKGNNGYEYKTTNLKAAKRILYNESRNNSDVHFGLIELNENGGWKQVLVEGTMNIEGQHEKIVSFVFDGETVYEVDGYVHVFDTGAEAMEAAERIAKNKNKVIKVYKNGKQIANIVPEEQDVKYTVSRFACSPEKEFDTVGEARLFAKDCAKKYGFVYTVNKVQGTIAQVIEEVKPPKKSEKRYNFYVEDYTKKREVPIMYGDYTKKEIIKEVQGWADKNNHTYKIFIADETSDKALAGRVFFKVINWKQTYKVGKTGSRLRFGEFSYEEAEKYCKEYAEKDGIAYTIYKMKIDEYGRDDVVPVINIYPPEKIAYYGVFGYSRTFDTLNEAVIYAENQRSKSELTVYKAVEIDCGLRVEKLDVRTVPAYKPKEYTHYELEINEYDETGYITKENEVKFKTLEEATACVDELIENAGENKIVLRLYKVTGEDFECLFTKIASKINGMIAVMKDTSGEIVAEKQAKYITDSELISMLVKEPVNANLYDFMREPERIKISKNGKKKLRAIREIVKRALVAIPEEKQLINTPNDAANLMMKRLRYETKEKFYIIILNTKNRVVNISRISEGSLSGSIVHPANVFKEVLKYETASSIILCHNHPSGEPTPSMEDIGVTHKLIKAGRLLDIEVLDHIVIGDGIFKSMKQKGILNNTSTLPYLNCEGR